MVVRLGGAPAENTIGSTDAGLDGSLENYELLGGTWTISS